MAKSKLTETEKGKTNKEYNSMLIICTNIKVIVHKEFILPA
jgi:hypothetical protein